MIREEGDTLILDVKVVPRSSQNKLEWSAGSMRLKITAPPVDGEANAAIIEFFVRFLHLPKKAVTIDKGIKSKNKVIRIDCGNEKVAVRVLLESAQKSESK